MAKLSRRRAQTLSSLLFGGVAVAVAGGAIDGRAAGAAADGAGSERCDGDVALGEGALAHAASKLDMASGKNFRRKVIRQTYPWPLELQQSGRCDRL